MKFSPLILYSNQNAEISKFSALKLKKKFMMKGFCCALKTHYLANTGIVFKIVCSRFYMGYLRKTTKIVKHCL